MLNLATFEERMNWIVNEAPGMHVCMYVCRCVCMHVIVYVCVHVYTYAYLCVCMHICVYVCVCPRLRSISTEYTYTQAAKEAKAEKKRARSGEASPVAKRPDEKPSPATTAATPTEMDVLLPEFPAVGEEVHVAVDVANMALEG
jgi:type IV secretory pathway VirB3-like protein